MRTPIRQNQSQTATFNSITLYKSITKKKEKKRKRDMARKYRSITILKCFIDTVWMKMCHYLDS